MPPEWELVLRLFVVAVLAGLIGIERELRDQPAGFRTHMLVGLGACLFSLISAYSFGGVFEPGPGVLIRYDPTRIAAQIVTGIGFLGAGAIIRYGMSVRGLTTAASLWVVAAIGTAVGFGAYLLAGATTTITLLALFLLRPLRSRLVRGLKRGHEEFVIDADRDVRLDELIRTVGEAGLRIDHIRVEEDDDASGHQVTLVLALPPERKPESVVALLREAPGVRNVDWSR
jgi:putative Mg2+ transporter-C (MgtC) family protein